MLLFDRARDFGPAPSGIDMTADSVAAAASVATFLVIAASATAALIQLRHMRNGNQIAVFNEIRHKLESAELRKALQFIRYELPAKMDEPALRARLLDPATAEGKAVTEVGNFLDSAVAPLVKHGFVDRNLACDLFYYPTVMCWDNLAPFIASARAMAGYRLWEDFEYLSLLCKEFRRRYPLGTYPRGASALPLPQPWPEAVRSNKTTAVE